MDFAKKRETDPEYLKSIIALREIAVEEEKQKVTLLTTQIEQLTAKLTQQNRSNKAREDAATLEIANLKIAISHLEAEVETLKHEQSENEFTLNTYKLKIQEITRTHANEIEKLKQNFDGQRSTLNSKVVSLEKNIADLKRFYKLDEAIQEDKRKIIEDSNRDLRGFSNEKQQRLVILQNQQFKNEIEHHSKHLTVELQRNEKLQEEIKHLKSDLQLHKEIEYDLVKRSSLAQTLIKKLNKQLQTTKQKLVSIQATSSMSVPKPSEQQTPKVSSNTDLTEANNKLKLENANLKNYINYLQNTNNNSTFKYETLGSILTDYLDHIMQGKGKNEGDNRGTGNIVLDIESLRVKDVKEWKFQELEAIKPFLSKRSLVHFPEMKNINISFMEQAQKEALSLPRIADDYQKQYEKDSKKCKGRFKDIPIDISTKILRSNLREWGTKIKHGNMPVVKKLKSKSLAEESDGNIL